MTTVSTTSAASTATSSAGSSVSVVNNQSDYNAAYTQFLGMLTTELQNQDPTSPMDTTQFTNQLVGFSQLEQQIQTNTSLNSLVSASSQTSIGNDIGYLGHTVTASGTNFTLDGSDPTTLTYSLPSTAATATLTVTNSSGTTVATQQVATASGLHSLSFDGSANGGTALPAGTYSYAITAQDANSNSITPTTYVNGAVTGIDTSSGTAMLTVNGAEVPASTVIAVTN